MSGCFSYWDLEEVYVMNGGEAIEKECIFSFSNVELDIVFE
jgi:hypothetical protein